MQDPFDRQWPVGTADVDPVEQRRGVTEQVVPGEEVDDHSQCRDPTEWLRGEPPPLDAGREPPTTDHDGGSHDARHSTRVTTCVPTTLRSCSVQRFWISRI